MNAGIDYTRRIHSGLIAVGEINAGNFLARRSLEDMRSTPGQFHGHRVMQQAALQGAIPTEGPLSRGVKPGNGEQMNRVEKEKENAILLCGQFEREIGVLRERHMNLLGRGGEKDRYERLLELMEIKRDNPESIRSDSSRSRVLERMNTPLRVS